MSLSPAVSWSNCGGTDCIRLAGLAAGTGPRVEVRPLPDAPPGPTRPAMAGRVVRDGDDLCFLPRFGFMDGTAYGVSVGGEPAAVLSRPRPDSPATTEVAGIWPTAEQVPRNLLRLYVLFSAPMSEGYAARQVRLTDDAGQPLAGALLPAEYELWDAAHQRLTVLLDPARIKRGLAAHREAGYPLRAGEAFRLVVEDGFRDACGATLRAPAQRRYQAGGDERRRVDPGAWTVAAPAAGLAGPVQVTFDRPLDRALLERCLRVAGPGGRLVPGTARPGPRELSWMFTPRQPWAPGGYRLLVDPVLEDLAGNSVRRVFDRDLARPDDRPPEASRAEVTFRVPRA
jgi:hypothetical protein